MTKITKIQTAVSTLVDTYADLSAQIAVLQEKADAVKATLKGKGVGEYHGSDVDAVVSESSRISDDAATKAIIDDAIFTAREGLSPQWKTAHPPIITTTLTLRLTKAKARIAA